MNHTIRIVIIMVLILFSISFGGTYNGGNGTEAQPYQISAVEDWQELMNTDADWGQYFILTADVNLAGILLTSIGNESTPFTGIFDGGNNIISNAAINQSGSDYVGLFGVVIDGQIHNLGVVDCNMTGGNYVGGLAGHNYGTITFCYATGLVNGSGYDTGGLAGVNYGTLTSCYAAGSVIGNCYVGGLVGLNYDILASCYAAGSVSGTGDCAGGLVGYNYGTLTFCYAAGSVSGVGDYVGGLVGFNDSGTAVDCFWDKNTSGQETSACGTGKTTVDMKTLSTFTSAGWDFTNETVNGTNDYWRMCVNAIDFPRLNWESIAGDFACPDGVNFIDFAYFAARWPAVGCDLSNNFCGGADMDISGAIDLTDLTIFAERWLD